MPDQSASWGAVGSSSRPGISSPLLEPPWHPQRDGSKGGMRETGALTATALSPGCAERNASLPSCSPWVLGSRSCLPGGVTPLHCLCAFLCVCCCHRRCTPSCHFTAHSRSLSRLSLSFSLPLFIIYGGLQPLSHAVIWPCGSPTLHARQVAG